MRQSGHHASALLVLITLALVAWLALYLPPNTPPQVVHAGAPETGFSAERARVHLRELTRAPRPLGSPGHAAARDYLLGALRGLGLEPEIQRTTVTRQFPHTVSAVEVQNIVARMPGTDSTGAVVLMAHYDSVTNSPGATDAGNGVAAILETVRALRAGPALRNDVIALITDAEEPGLMGARAYVDEHPWAADTGVVLNAEGRGHTGPVVIFRTTGDNGSLIQTLADAVPGALADSMAGEAFRYMPNDTDLSVFDAAGYAGIDFANAHGITHYHYPLDSYEEADPRSLQNHGNYMLSLARAFGEHELPPPAAPDRVYFSLPLAGLVHYPAAWALPLALLAALAVVVVLVHEARRGRLGLRGTLLGLAHFTIALIAVPLATVGAWLVVRGGIPEVARFRHGTPYDDGYYLLALCLLAGALYLALVAWARRRLQPGELLAAPLCVWALLGLVCALWAPGASYPFLWPLLSVLAGLVLANIAGQDRPWLQTVVLVLAAVPVLVIAVPMIEATAVMMTFEMLSFPLILLVLTLALLAPHVHRIVRGLAWWPSAALFVAVAGMLLVGLATAGYDERHKLPNSVNYIADVDEQKAWWYSLDPEPDAWTRLYLGEAPAREALPEWVRQPMSRRPWLREAPLLRTDAPDATVLEDGIDDGERRLRLRLDLPSEVFVTVVRVLEVPEARLLRINGREAPDGPGRDEELQVYYYGRNPDGVEIEIAAPAGAPLKLYLRSNIPGLPSLGDHIDRRRPPHTMPAGSNADLTRLQRTIELPPMEE